MRFSPVSGTTSATVAMATSLRNDSADAAQLFRGPLESAQQRLHQLERHARAAQVLLGVAAVRPIGIEHGHGRRQLRLGQVMIGDDHVDAQLVGARAPLRRRESRCPR